MPSHQLKSTYQEQHVQNLLGGTKEAIGKLINELDAINFNQTDVARANPNNLRLQAIGSQMRHYFELLKQQKEIQDQFALQTQQMSNRELFEQLAKKGTTSVAHTTVAPQPNLTPEQQSKLSAISLTIGKISHVNQQLANINRQFQQQADNYASAIRVNYNMHQILSMRNGRQLEHQLNDNEAKRTIIQLLKATSSSNQLDLIAKLLQEQGHVVKASDTKEIQKISTVMKSDVQQLEANNLSYEDLTLEFEGLVEKAQQLLAQRTNLIKEYSEQTKDAALVQNLTSAFNPTPAPGSKKGTVEDDEMLRYSYKAGSAK